MFETKYNVVSTEVEFSDPTTEHSNLPLKKRSARSRIKALGWRFTIINGAILSLIVFILNLTATLWAQKYRVKDDEREKDEERVSREALYSGDCDQVKRMSFAAHLFINLFSTILLSASNFAMQCLSSPTRDEIDKAHAQSIWLDVGILSLRNITRIDRKRALLCFLLVFTSLPLHLMYNSAVYSTVHLYDYSVYSANETLIQDKNKTMVFNLNLEKNSMKADVLKLRDAAAANELTRLEAQECISNYATTFQTRFRHLILVSDGSVNNVSYDYSNLQGTTTRFLNATGSFVRNGSVPYGWICGQQQDQSQPLCTNRWKKINAAQWAPLGNKVSYCLAEQFEQKCELRFSSPLIVVVLIFNFTKTVVLFYIYFFMKDNPLLTLGDAIASFLRNVDETTKGYCLLSKDTISRWDPELSPEQREAQPYTELTRVWGMAATGGRWWACIILYLGAIITCITLLGIAISSTGSSFKALLALGPGAVDPRTLLNWDLPSSGVSGLMHNTIVANLPQLGLSVIYFTYNGLLTSFMLSFEWDGFATNRKGLRVSHDPCGAQRSTHFLQLPYKFAGPLMLFSGLLHWFCSSSLFLVMLQLDGDIERATCGYSTSGILGLIILGTFMLLGSFTIGNRRFKSSVPCVGSCSAAISAMVHPPHGEPSLDAEYLPVQWGVVAGTKFTEDGDKYGHCSVSAQPVSEPEEGHLYAG